jgi:extracellular factor (EF) 3-hydroxypalmitic acid methyl ester biosynthesis protein
MDRTGTSAKEPTDETDSATPGAHAATPHREPHPMTGNTKGSRDALADSVVVFVNSQGISARGTLVSLKRTLIIFEVYNPYSIVQMSEVLKEVRITRRQRTIYTGRAMVSNLVSTGLMLIVSAALVDPWSELEGLNTQMGVREEAERFLDDWRDASDLEPSFQLSISRFKGFLVEFNRWLEGTELTLGQSPTKQRAPLARELADQVYECSSARMAELIDSFEREYQRIDPERHDVHKYHAQRELHPLVLVSPWAHRCFSKPFGYAGDYEMLNMLLRDPYEGPSTYAWMINRYLLTTAPSIAYANRIAMLVEHLRFESHRVRRAASRPLKALSVGCGPVNEVQRFLREDSLSAGCEFHLMDFNQPTIDFAREQVELASRERGNRISATFVHRSIHELLQDARGHGAAGTPEYDLIYCAGLFDYLSDRICGGLIEQFYSQLIPGGLVIVTNVENSRPIVASLEMLMEWYLIYRDRDAMLALKPGLGEQSVACDVTGINQFLLVRKPK